jgi:hypothetical protein
MGLLKKVRDWDASYDADERRRPGPPAGGSAPSSGGLNEAQLIAAILKVVALLQAVFGVLGGIVVGVVADDAVGGGGGFDPAGFIAIGAALFGALLLWALAAGLSCLDDIRRNTSRQTAS